MAENLYVSWLAPSPSETPNAPKRAVAAIFITDPEQKTATTADMLRVLFSLTRADSQLAVALVDGNSMQQPADILGIAKETARSRLKNIFEKTRTRRQSELIRLLTLVSP